MLHQLTFVCPVTGETEYTGIPIDIEYLAPKAREYPCASCRGTHDLGTVKLENYEPE